MENNVYRASKIFFDSLSHLTGIALADLEQPVKQLQIIIVFNLDVYDYLHEHTYVVTTFKKPDILTASAAFPNTATSWRWLGLDLHTLCFHFLLGRLPRPHTTTKLR
jgi:hypothetical protein